MNHKHGYRIIGLLALGLSVGSSAQESGATPTALDYIRGLDGLIAYWDFSEPAGKPRVSRGTPQAHALQEIGGPIERRDEGPLSGKSAHLDGTRYFSIPRADIGDLDIHGPDAQVSMLAFVKLESLRRGVTIAGIWSEGQGAHDNSGVRQYSLLLNMPLYGGGKQVTPHVSATGGASMRQDGSTLAWCADFAASRSEVELHRWVSLGFTYDGTWIKAYYNGVMEERALQPKQDRRTDPYFTTEGPDGGDRGMNPYYQPRGIYTFKPNTPGKMPAGAPFTVGARQAVGKKVAETLKGAIGGLLVFDRALTADEMLRLHLAGGLPAPAGHSTKR